MSKEVNQTYQSFLVRCWLSPSELTTETSAWRFELQEVSAESQKFRFSDLKKLNAFISARLTAVTEIGTQKDDPHSLSGSDVEAAAAYDSNSTD